MLYKTDYYYRLVCTNLTFFKDFKLTNINKLFSLQIFFRILPSSSQSLSYNLHPLMSGYVQLPELQLNIPHAPSMTKPVVAAMLPSHIYIKVIIF